MPHPSRHVALLVVGIATLLVSGNAATLPADHQPEVPAMADADRVCIDEARHLAKAVGDTLWQGWNDAPFAILLVTPEREFLVGHPEPTPDFVRMGVDTLLDSAVWTRPRQFDVGLLASFPAVGATPTIVIGQPANTAARSSPRWVLTLLHEHFHQWQYSRPGYYQGVAALGLAGTDTSGSWMLNYPFPYKNPDVAARFETMCARLGEAISTPEAEPLTNAVSAYLAAKRALRDAVSKDDYAYLNFQLWQEGIARYTESRIASFAATRHTPRPGYLALPDAAPYAAVAQELSAGIHAQLKSPKLAENGRSAFYAVGAGEGLLLDRVRPGWRADYARAGFTLDRLLGVDALPSR